MPPDDPDQSGQPDQRVNNVTFSTGGDEAYLTLDQDWVMSAGESPNVNVATVPAAEFAKLGSVRTGTVSFYFSDEDDADVTLDNVQIVDIQPGRIGIVQGDSSLTFIDYKIAFADARRGLVSPRGGILRDGDVNPEPLPPDSDAGDILDCTELITKCLTASGLTFEVGDFSAASPMRKLQWFGARAPEELSKLLQWCGGTLYVTSSGTVGATTLGDGDQPDISADDTLANLQLPSIDRRGKTAIYVSAPTASQEIHDSNDDAPPEWIFVARDTDGSWQSLDDNSLLTGFDPPKVVANGFTDIPEQYRGQLIADMYHCIQLDKDDYDPRYSSLLKQVATSDGYLNDLSATATIAYFSSPDGVWRNSGDDVQLTPTHVYGPQNVIRFAERLGKVSVSPTFQPDANFEQIDPSNVTVTFAIESAGASGIGKGYFACGFTSDNGSIKTLPSADVTSALESPGEDIVILHAPAARLRKLNGDADGANLKDLTDTCKSMAAAFLKGSDNASKLIVARGFQAVELSGVVSEIRYSQSAATTSIRVNSWFSPGSAFQVSSSVAGKLVSSTARSGVAAGGSAGGEAFPQASVTQGDRAAMGASGASQPLHVIGAPPAAIGMRYDCAVKITGNENGTGMYDGRVADLPLAPNATNGLTVDFSQANPDGTTGTQALIANLGEVTGGDISGQAGSHVIPSESVIAGTRGPKDPATGKVIVWVYYDPSAFRSFQFVTATDGSGNKLFQGSRAGNATHPPAANDPSWNTLLVFKPCSTS